LRFNVLIAIACASVPLQAQEKAVVAAPVITLPAPVADASDARQRAARDTAPRQETAARAQSAAPEAPGPQVRLVALETDVAKRYRVIVPPLPFPPFSTWRKWFRDHAKAVHCALEWCDDSGAWWHGELRSMQFAPNSDKYRVGTGEFPGTAYHAYGVYIIPGRVSRDKDNKGKPVVVALDEEVDCDYRKVEAEIKKYGRKDARSGAPGTGGSGRENVGLGGPAYKPAQNSNTMINYVLRRCGVSRPAPPLAVGWDTQPRFPYSSNADAPALDNQPQY
jgi:hypothetical protein